jgi:hypothetical protein
LKWPEPNAASAVTNDCGVRYSELEQYAHGELTAGRRAEIESSAETCKHCQTELSALKRDNQAFLEQVNVAAQSARILDSLESRENRPWFARFQFSQWVGALTLVVAMAFIVPAIFNSDRSVNRIKGENVGLQVYLNTEEEPQLITKGSELRDGDQIQFRYQARGYPFLMIVSVDGRQNITSLYPSVPGPSISVAPEGSHILAGSIILDDAIGFERIFAIYSESPLDYYDVEKILEDELELSQGHVTDLEPASFADGTEYATVDFEKVE